MKPLQRDGTIHWHGLVAEFRFVSTAPHKPDMSWVDTATGSHCVRDELLTYDPPRDLSPEAAAVVAGENV